MIELLYSCRCRQDEKVEVPSRHKNTDVADWMELVAHCVSIDHRAKSPLCNSTKMQTLKIPYEEGQGVGMQETRQ